MTDVDRLVKAYREAGIIENIVNATVLIPGFEFKDGEKYDDEIMENITDQIGLASLLADVVANAVGLSEREFAEAKWKVIDRVSKQWEVQ